MDVGCQCPQLDDGFDTPATDNAPWYEPSRYESADFLGFWMNEAKLQPVMSRNVSQNGRRSSSLGPLATKGRILQAQGLMMARSAEGMSYGESWLAAVLRGSACNGDGCPTDDATILPACPELPGYDESKYFRTLVDVGLVDGPVFSSVISNEWYVQQASFVLTSSQPWLYHPATRCLEDELISEVYGSPTSCSLTTPEWMGDGTFVIDIANVDTIDTTDLVIKGRISPDGSCPVTGLGTSIPESFIYRIPTLKPEDRIVIDGMRRKALYYDASRKTAASALPYMEFEGPYLHPDVGPCTTLCLEITSSGGDATATVDSHLKEL